MYKFKSFFLEEDGARSKRKGINWIILDWRSVSKPRGGAAQTQIRYLVNDGKGRCGILNWEWKCHEDMKVGSRKKARKSC